jgi:hypothetical protein
LYVYKDLIKNLCELSLECDPDELKAQKQRFANQAKVDSSAAGSDSIDALFHSRCCIKCVWFGWLFNTAVFVLILCLQGTPIPRPTFASSVLRCFQTASVPSTSKTCAIALLSAVIFICVYCVMASSAFRCNAVRDVIYTVLKRSEDLTQCSFPLLI